MLRRLALASLTLAALGLIAPTSHAEELYAPDAVAPQASPAPIAPVAPAAYAREQPAPASAPLEIDTSKENGSVGMSLHRFQDDFGLGATATTPAIAHWIRFTLGAGVAWYPYGQTASGNQTWDPFYHGRIVVEVGPGYLRGVPIRPYGFGGVQAILLPSNLSSNHVAMGGLGGFGAELAFMAPGRQTGPVTYFMELGGVGTGATANKLGGDPSVASGFLISAGLRVYL
jgi:hypothetical protein